MTTSGLQTAPRSASEPRRLVRAAFSMLFALAGCQLWFDRPQPTGGAGGAGGGGGTGGALGGTGGVGGLEGVATDWGLAVCERIFACMPFATRSRWYGEDQADCAARRARFKARSLAAPGVSSDLGSVSSCTVALGSAECSAFVDLLVAWDVPLIPECAFAPGTLSNGEGCTYSAQCASTHCNSAAPGVCGTCQTLRELGESCASLPCNWNHGLRCNSLGTCVLGSHEGEPCSAAETCHGNLWCDAGTCTPFLDEGAPCKPSTNRCSFGVGGLICNIQSNSCEPLDPSAKEGEDCGIGVPGGGCDTCLPGLLCDMDTQTTSEAYSGSCVPATAGLLGGTCEFQTVGLDGPPCADDDLRCEGGLCVLDDPTLCP